MFAFVSQIPLSVLTLRTAPSMKNLTVRENLRPVKTTLTVKLVALFTVIRYLFPKDVTHFIKFCFQSK